ncbi:unnamed protein product [Cuscuta epithymum]|uniref:BED-type domain-containing protein n=1 Tax=Cuscuta epithymum TaxID=186058 RepID=A0AAV0G9G2_9ASTE|nr:unnamed protein product [Cuscuta epithymum]
MESNSSVMQNNFDKWKDPKIGLWWATCKWCKKECCLGRSHGVGMPIKHMKSCDKGKTTTNGGGNPN